MTGGATGAGATGGDGGDGVPSEGIAWRRVLRAAAVFLLPLFLVVGALMLLARSLEMDPLLLGVVTGVVLPAIVGLALKRAESFNDAETVLLITVTLVAALAGAALPTFIGSLTDDDGDEVDVTRRGRLSVGGQWRGGELYEVAIGKPPARDRLDLRWKVDDDSPGGYLGNCLGETRLFFRGADVTRQTEAGVEDGTADIPVESHGGGRSSIEVRVSGDSACEFSLEITSAVLRDG